MFSSEGDQEAVAKLLDVEVVGEGLRGVCIVRIQDRLEGISQSLESDVERQRRRCLIKQGQGESAAVCIHNFEKLLIIAT